MLRDLRTALRGLRHAPGFTLVAALTLALGIAATTTIFTLVNAIFLRPLPGVVQPAGLVRIFASRRDGGHVIRNGSLSYTDVEALAARRDLFAGVAAHGVQRVAFGSGDAATTEEAALVTRGYFGVFGVRAAAGRLFTPEEHVPGGPVSVAVLSHRLWIDRFGGDPAVVGRTVQVNAHPVQIVGVAPAAFRGFDIENEPALWIPEAAAPVLRAGDETLLTKNARWLRVVARRRDDVSRARIDAALPPMARAWADADSATHGGWSLRATSGGTLVPLDPQTTPQVIAVMAALGALAALVLAVTAANVANLLLARAVRRRREIAMRAALGAGRARLVRQLLAESVVLAAVAGMLGIALTGAVARLLPRLNLPAMLDFSPDGRVLAFTSAIALVTGVLFGLAPALHATGRSLAGAIKDGAAGSGRSKSRLRGTLVVGQMAISLVLLVAAGLVLRTVDGLRTATAGFDAQRVLVVPLDLGTRGYDDVRGPGVYAQLLERVRAIPGVERAALATMIPFGNRVYGISVTLPEGAEPTRETPTQYGMVGSDFFSTLDLPLAAGRPIDATDRAGGQPVAVVSESFARRHWPGERALGKHVRIGGDAPVSYEVVGVARDVRLTELTGPIEPMLYLPLAQRYDGNAALEVRTRASAAAITGAVRAAVRATDPDLPLGRVSTLEDYRDEAMTPTRLMATMLALFGAMALAVAAVGLGGVVAFAAAERTREIGVRLALGADARDVLRLVVGQGVRMALVGVAIGVPLAVGVGRLLGAQLYGVGAADPLTLGATVLVLGGVAVLASWIPARRAARLEPATVLRSE